MGVVTVVSSSFQVTTVVTSFVFRVLQSVAVSSFLTQLTEVGFLVHWESLLSTHGDEIGMLEDFIVAIHDLNNMKFKVCGRQIWRIQVVIVLSILR